MAKIETIIKNLFDRAIATHIETTGHGLFWKEQAIYSIDGHQINLVGADLSGAAQMNVTLESVRWFATLTNEVKDSRQPATRVYGTPKRAWVPQPDLDIRPSSQRIAEALTEIAAGRV